MRRAQLSGWLVVALGAAGAAVALGSSPAAAAGSCAPPRAAPLYVDSIERAVASGPDLWGSRLLASRSGPTLAAAERFLAPLLLATQRGQRPLTPSGFYYVPLSFGFSSYGPAVFALHVADGSEIITRHVGGPSLTFYVGNGRERYGSCTARLHPARLAEGYLPIVQTSYVDANGVSYRQESFVGRAYGARSVVSFVKLDVDATTARSGATVRLVPWKLLAHSAPDRLAYRGGTRLIVSDGAEFVDGVVRYRVPRGGVATIYAEWLNGPSEAKTLRADAPTYDAAQVDGRQLLDDPPHVGHAVRRARAGRRQRGARRARAGAGVRLALQRRQSLRGALLRRGTRLGRGRGGIRLPERREGDPAGLARTAQEEAQALHRVPGRPPALDRRALLPPDPRPVVHPERDARARPARAARSQARQVERGPARGRLRPEQLSSDIPYDVDSVNGDGRGLAGTARDRPRVGRHRASRRRRARARASGSASARPCARACARRAGACPTAPSSCPTRSMRRTPARTTS